MAFPGVALGQFETVKDHMRALRTASDIVNERSGKVGHEFVSEGSMWFGQNADPGNTDETAKFPSVVALVWRWTGDDRFRDDMYDFAKRNLRYIVRELDADGDGWPEGLGNVEREGMGPEKLDNTVYFIRGLFDLADMARAKGDGATRAWAEGLARDLLRRFEAEWWMDGGEPPCGLARRGGREDPAEALDHGHADGGGADRRRPSRVPGLTTLDHGTRSLALHETPCFSGERPLNRGLFHTGCGGGPTGAGEATIFGLNTAIQSVGEGNYGRLAEQRRYTEANIEPMFSEPAPAARRTSSPARSPRSCRHPVSTRRSARSNIDRCWTCRAMFMQAWGHYATAWPVVHQHLGVRPDLGRGALTVVPQVPPYEERIAGRNIRLGEGAVDVVAADNGRRHRTVVETGLRLRDLTVGHTVPRDAQVTQVLLDGNEVRRPILRETNRGLEVLAEVPGGGRGRHVLVVVAD